jgi:hypothetical protein
MLVVPTEQVKRDAEREGLHGLPAAAPVRSRRRCAWADGDIGKPGQLSSTSNRKRAPGSRRAHGARDPLVAAASALPDTSPIRRLCAGGSRMRPARIPAKAEIQPCRLKNRWISASPG